MRTRSVLLKVIATVAGFATVSQAAILVGPTGTGTNNFDAAPAATEWSTLSVGSSAVTYEGTPCGLEVNLVTTDASTVTAALTTDASATPASFATARWNSTGLFLQTRPTGNDYILLMATLQNNSGGTIANLNVHYDFGKVVADTTETIKSHRAFYSLTGASDSWVFIPEFSGASAGALVATLNLGSWTNGSPLYIIWADDNGSGTEGAFTLDNFYAIDATLEAPTASPLAINSISFGTAAGTYCWSLFAGSLTSEGCTDNTGSAATFSQVYGLDINGTGDMLFVADRSCNSIRTVTIPGGVVTNVYNSDASALVMLAVNKSNGNVYFPAITGTLGIYKLEATNNNYGTATLVMPGNYGNGLAVDSTTDTVYASRTGENQIDKIENAGTTPTVTLTIGSGAGGNVDGTLTGCSLNAPMGGAVRGTGASAVLYFMDRVGHSVRRIDLANDWVATVAGGAGAGTADGTGTAAKFSQPHNCVLSPDGNTLFVCDQDNYTVRMVTDINGTNSGVVTTIMGVNQGASGIGGATEGCGAAALNGDLGQITIDSAGNIYTGDRGDPAGSTAHIMKGVPTPGGPVVLIDFTAPASYGSTFCPAKALSLQSSSTVDGTYTDTTATIRKLSATTYQAEIALTSDEVQFYRIKFE